MLTVQFAGPQNLRSCPERGGEREEAEPLPERPGVQRRRKCELSPPPNPGARPGLLWSHPWVLASEGRGSHPSAPLAPGTWRKEPGVKTQTWWSRGIDQVSHPHPHQMSQHPCAGLLRFMNQSSQSDNKKQEESKERLEARPLINSFFFFLLIGLKKIFIESGDVIQIMVTCI